MTMFQPATKKQARARVAMSGPSGSGKTMWSLIWASTLAGDDGKIAFIDTERGSASLYADRFKFDVLQLNPPFHPDRLINALNEAHKAGYTVVIVDSLTHFWSGAGGVLEIVDEASARFKGNSHAAWQVGTPIQQKMVDALLAFDGHLIATMRAKTEWVMEQGQNGKMTPRKIGLAPQQRSDIEFEFTLFLDIDHQHRATVGKTRYAKFQDRVFNPDDAGKAAEDFAGWLQTGETNTPSVQPQPKEEQPKATPEVADPEIIAIRGRINALTDSARAELRKVWTEMNLPKVAALTSEHITLAQAAVDAVTIMRDQPTVASIEVDESLDA